MIQTNRKKSIAILLCLTLLMSCVPNGFIGQTTIASASKEDLLTDAITWDISQGNIEITATGYIVSGASIEVPYTGNYIITGTTTGSNNYIKISGQPENAQIMLNDLNMVQDGPCPIMIETKANLIIGPDGVKLCNSSPCILLEKNASLSVTGTGSFTLTTQNAPAIYYQADSFLSIGIWGNINIEGGVSGYGDLMLNSIDESVKVTTKDMTSVNGKNISIAAKKSINITSEESVAINASGNITIKSQEDSIDLSSQGEHTPTVAMNELGCKVDLSAQKDITMRSKASLINTYYENEVTLTSNNGSITLDSMIKIPCLSGNISVTAPKGVVSVSNASPQKGAPIVNGALSVTKGTICNLSGGILNMTYAEDGTIDRVLATYKEPLDFKEDTEEANQKKAAGYTWDQEKNILTLRNLTLQSEEKEGIILPKDTKVVLEGTNQIEITKDLKTDKSYGIRGSGTLNLSGEGTLKIITNKDSGSCIFSDAVQIENATLDLSGENGVIAQNGDITIENGTVTANVESNGIVSEKGNLLVKGGAINIPKCKYGLAVKEGDLSIDGGVVTIKATNIGLIANGNITISADSMDIFGEEFGIAIELKSFENQERKLRFLNGISVIEGKKAAVLVIKASENKTDLIPQQIEINTEVLAVSGGALSMSEPIKVEVNKDFVVYAVIYAFSNAKDGVMKFDSKTETIEGIASKISMEKRNGNETGGGSGINPNITSVPTTIENKDGTTTTVTKTTTEKNDGSVVVKEVAVNKDKNKQTIKTSETVTVKAKDGSVVTTKIEQNEKGRVISSTATVSVKEVESVVREGVAKIGVTVSDALIRSAFNATDQKMDLTVFIPSEEIKKQLSDKSVKEGEIVLNLPESVMEKAKVNLDAIQLPKEVLDAAKEIGKSIKVSVKTADGKENAWSFDEDRLKKSTRPIKDINLLLETANADKLGKTKAGVLKGMVIDFKQEGMFPATATVTMLALAESDKTGIKAGSKVYLYGYDKETGRFLELPITKYVVDERGYIAVDITKGSEYILLSKKLKTNVVSLLDQVRVEKKTTLSATSDKASRKVEVAVTDYLVPVKKFSKDRKLSVGEVQLSYQSSNISIVTVSSNGSLSPKKPGTATITVTAKLVDGTKKTYKEKITVK